MIAFNSKCYATLGSMLLSGCLQQNVVLPSDHFKVQGYSVYSGGKPGDYYIVHIGDRTHYYFWKKLRDGNDLIIHDWEGDLTSDRVIVLSREGIIIGVDTKYLETSIVSRLDDMLLKSEKQVIGKKL